MNLPQNRWKKETDGPSQMGAGPDLSTGQFWARSRWKLYGRGACWAGRSTGAQWEDGNGMEILGNPIFSMGKSTNGCFQLLSCGDLFDSVQLVYL